jgi:hypothetical protein
MGLNKEGGFLSICDEFDLSYFPEVTGEKAMLAHLRERADSDDYKWSQPMRRALLAFLLLLSLHAARGEPLWQKNPTFAAFIERAGHEYAKLSATPKDYDPFVAQISKMWETDPNWTDTQLQSIQAPVLVADARAGQGEFLLASKSTAGRIVLIESILRAKAGASGNRRHALLVGIVANWLIQSHLYSDTMSPPPALSLPS